jgi:tRNA(adenine34) deaminase
MKRALTLAKQAAALGEVPVGAVVVKNGRIIGEGQNSCETDKSALSHAEFYAIGNACRELNSWRLSGCTLYVTLEPCPMCAGAMINSVIDRVVFGAANPKYGAAGSIANLFHMQFPHKPFIKGGILQEECSEVLQIFFDNVRKSGQ